MKIKFEITIDSSTQAILERIACSLEGIRFQSTNPGNLLFKITKENEMGFFAIIGLPTITSADVASQELTVQVGDQPASNAVYTVEDMITPEFAVGEAGTIVKASLVYVDAAGNRSEPREELFTVVDTIAPQQPGEFSMSVTRQE